MTDADPLAPRPFRPLGSYDWPSRPTEQAVQRWWSDIRDSLGAAADDGPLVATARLGRISSARLDEIAGPPACAPVMDELTLSYAEWVERPASGARVQVVVMPPCETDDILGRWANARGLDVLRAPGRDLLTEMPGPDAPDLDGEGVLVVPLLERWFVRDADGLDTIRALLAAIGAAQRPILIGCNSWAWAYLSKSVDAALLMPSAQTFQAFDGARLRAWFADLSGAVRGTGMRFRLTGDGTDVFGVDKPDETHEFFTRLAARSLGIPWIAWEIWRAAISDLHPDSDEEREDLPDIDDDGTFWIADTPDPKLPPANRKSALLTLHALLVHGGLPAFVLDRVLPLPDVASTVPALIGAGLIARDGERLHIAPTAYPAVRSELGKAGYPRDRM